MADEAVVPPAADTPQSVLDAIAQNALDATGGDVWRAGQPLATKAAPAQEKGSAEAPPATDGSTPPPAKEMSVSEAEKLVLEELGPLAGKYNSLAELKKGLHELISQRNALLESQPPPDNAPPAPETDPLEELTMFGLPKEPLAKAVDAAVDRAIEKRQRAATEAQKVQIEADKAIIEKYPEYQERFDELTEFLRENSDIGRSVLEAEKAGYHLLAREYAWLQFSRSENGKSESDLKEKAEARKAERTVKRNDARTVSPKQREEPRVPEQEGPKPLTKEEFDSLKALAKEGYEQPLYRRAIGDWLPKDIFPDTV